MELLKRVSLQGSSRLGTRQRQEDSYAAYLFGRIERFVLKRRVKGTDITILPVAAAVVADGMGGHTQARGTLDGLPYYLQYSHTFLQGEEAPFLLTGADASHTAVRGFMERLRKIPAKNRKASDPQTLQNESRIRLKNTVEAAGNDIYDTYNGQAEGKQRLGATVSGVYLEEKRNPHHSSEYTLYAAAIGDSPIGIRRKGRTPAEIEWITTDDHIAGAPRNVVSNIGGTTPTSHVNQANLLMKTLQRGDEVVICTDGVGQNTFALDERKITTRRFIIAGERRLSARKLVKAAVSTPGSHDNATALVIRVNH